MNDSGLNNKLIINLSLYGVLIGITSVMGFVYEQEWLLWLFGWLGVALIVSRKCREKYFLNSFLTGFMITFLSVLMKTALYDTYTENNPWFLQQLSDKKYDVNPRMYIISLGLITAVINGLVTGFLTLGLRKFGGKKT